MLSSMSLYCALYIPFTDGTIKSPLWTLGIINNYYVMLQIVSTILFTELMDYIL